MFNHVWLLVALGVGLFTMNLKAQETVMPDVLKEWTVFAHVDLEKVDVATLTAIPNTLPGSKQDQVSPQTLVPTDGNLMDIGAMTGKPFAAKDAAILMTIIHCDKPMTLKLGASADWWMSWHVNGKEIFSTMELGNRMPVRSIKDMVFLMPLQTGDNLVSVVVKAGSAGWKLIAGSDESIKNIKPFFVKHIEDYRDKPFDYIIDEETVRKYELPDVLLTKAGNTVTNVHDWETIRRPELLKDFSHYVYGAIPSAPDQVEFQTIEQDDVALDGKAVYRKVRITLTRGQKQFAFHLHVYTPKSDTPSPVFLLTNNRQRPEMPVDPDKSFWPARWLVSQGFAAVMLANKELAQDRNDEFRDGIMQLYPELNDKPEAWHAISAWAYGVSRSVDFLVQDKAIDASRISVVGHSRGGKIALWASVNDPRIAMACINDSGCTGTAIARRKVGETISDINNQFPHWFNDIYKQYNNREDDLPVDQHMLVAMMAPRVVCVGSAIEDLWADPYGEFLATVYATPVFKLYGLAGMSEKAAVTLDGHTIGGNISYHIRNGGHGLIERDWECYVEAARHYMPKH